MFLKGDFGDLVIIRSNEHSFLGMNIIMRDDSKVQVEMKDQLEELFEMFGEELSEKASIPAAKHLWNVEKDSN